MSKKKILIVDDEQDFCDSFKNYFVKREYLVNTAYDGVMAKDLLENNKYDFIFFDCNMPELTGAELVKVIKEKNPEAKKIMVSGYDLINKDFAKNLIFFLVDCIVFLTNADVAQLVERGPSKSNVARSNRVIRLILFTLSMSTIS